MKRFFLLPAVLLVVLSIVLIGCGGGGGGGGNPVATTGEGQLVSLSGRVLLNNVPQAGVSVYLYRADEAEIAGLADQYTARASVRGALLPDSTADERTTVTDGNGVYRFDGVPEGEYTLMAQKSATQRAALTRIVLSSVNGAMTTKDASLQPTSDIAGTITVSGVSDLSGGRVYLLGTSFTSITDSAGNFRISYVPTGTGFQLMADFGGAVLPAPVTIEAVAGSTTGSPALSLPLALAKPAMVTGNIVGTAIRTLFAPGDENTHAGTLVYLMQNGLFLNMTETGPAGGYRFFGLSVSPNNVYQIRFASPNYIPSPGEVEVAVAANTDTAATPVTLSPKVQSAVLGRLRGRVLKQSFLGLDQETNAVMLRLATGTTLSDRLEFNVESDDQGVFLFTGIPVGTYTLACADPDYVFLGGPITLAVLAPINDLSAASPFPLAPAATAKRLGGLTGRVVRNLFVDAEPTTELLPLRIATGTPGTAGFLEKITMTETDGTFAFTGIPVGTYTLRCGNTDYLFATGSPIATVVAALPALNNGQFNLIPNPAAGGTGGLVATISTAIAVPIRVTFVSQTTETNNRDVYTVPAGTGLQSLFVKNLVPGSYSMHLDPATGYDFSVAVNPVTITANAIATLPANLIPVSILPTITAVAQVAGSVTVSGVNLNAAYRIQLSHIGGDPWFDIPTSLSGGSLVGNTGLVPGGKYNIRILHPQYSNLTAADSTIVQILPAAITAIASAPAPYSIGVAWSAPSSDKQFVARIALSSTPAVPLQVIRTTELAATFTGLLPATSYDVTLYGVADGLYSAAFTNSIFTQAIQPVETTYAVTGYASMTAVITPAARNGLVYYVTYNGATTTLQQLNTVALSSATVTLPGTIISPTLCLGDYIYVTSYANDGVRAYNYNLSGPVNSFKPVSLGYMSTTVSPRDGKVYCFWSDSGVQTASMTVLSSNLSPLSGFQIPNAGGVSGMACQASADGSQIGFHYTSGANAYFYLISAGTNLPAPRLAYAQGVTMWGGPSGSVYTYESTPGFQEVYLTGTGSAAVRPALFPAGYSEYTLDHNQNRWAFMNVGGLIRALVARPDGSQLLQYDFSGGTVRGACFDPILKRVFVLHGDPDIAVTGFDANL